MILVITDDQGYGDLSCHGNPVLKTPNLDDLFAKSIRLTDYHVAPTCSPTRAALQSGHWTNRTGCWHTILGRSLLRADEPTLGEIFSSAGYATGMFGKWHLGDNFPYRPEDRGFQEVMRHGGGGVGQTPDYWDNAYFDGSYFYNGKPKPVQGYCTDVFFDHAKQFIQQQAAAGKPFFAYISTNAPHGPNHAPLEFAEPYQDDFETRTAHFLGMIANIDQNVGELRKFLEQQNLANDTIFIFTTDNGTAGGDKIFNAKMRGKKGSPYDGGHRVPFFIHWPKGGFDDGQDVNVLSHAVDVLPTLLDLCQIKPTRELKPDGKSLAGLLNGNPDSSVDWENRVLITDSQRVSEPVMWKDSAVMTKRWRLINGAELYDMASDPGQRRDVAVAYPAIVRQLRAKYQTWWEELVPTFRHPIPIYLGADQDNPATLTCHDWIAKTSTPWNQAAIRRGIDGDNMTGYWNVNVTQAGKYRIRLRRWPAESNAGLQASLPPGDTVPGNRPFRATPGKSLKIQSASIQIGDINERQKLQPDDQEAIFEMQLPAGITTLQGTFHRPDGNTVGAYYAYVERLRE